MAERRLVRVSRKQKFRDPRFLHCVESVFNVAHSVNGPVYLRTLRGEVPRLFDRSEPFVLGCARELSTGDDLAIITSGICTEEALRVTHLLYQRGVSTTHLHVSTLKPFTDPLILNALSSVKRGVITMENHSIIGGLGSAVARNLAALLMPKYVEKKLTGLRNKILQNQSQQGRRWRLLQVESAIACNLRCVMCPWREITKNSENRGLMAQHVWDAIRPHLPQIHSIDFTGDFRGTESVIPCCFPNACKI